MHAPPPPTMQSVAQPDPEPPPKLIEIRVLVVAYEGAQGAAADQKRTRAEARERARTIAAMIKSGEHMAELVPTYSDRAGAADDRGVTRVRLSRPEPFSAEVAKVAGALPIGKVSEPLDTPDGYLVIERLKDPPVGPERVSARHILIGYATSTKPIEGATRSEAEARAIADKVDAEAKKPGANFKELAEQYTEEPGGKERGGDLGSFGHGQMVPAFDQAVFALDVGQVSDVVQSPFGFHVIQRYE